LSLIESKVVVCQDYSFAYSQYIVEELYSVRQIFIQSFKLWNCMQIKELVHYLNYSIKHEEVIESWLDE